MHFDELPKNRQGYEELAQITNKGLSVDFLNFLAMRLAFDNLEKFKLETGKEDKVRTIFERIVKQLKTTPAYSARYLNDEELEQAATYGVTREDLINPKTEVVIKRLDEMALRLREIGAQLTQDNHKGFADELQELYLEASRIIKG